MADHLSKDPLHGITLEMQINALVAHYGWDKLGKLDLTLGSLLKQLMLTSLKFLHRTPWARAEVEALYLDSREDFSSTDDDNHNDDPWANSRMKKS